MRDLPEATVIDGRYEVLNRLGSGGMADVYCAQDLQLGRKVALKLLHDRFAEDEEFVERFRREASAAAGLQHPHVVSVYDRGEWAGTSYIAMEFVDGRTLKQIVQQDGPLDPARAIDLVVQILRATRFAHRRGVIHRDLKPHNVIVDEEGRAKVTDFGIARAGASDMTQTGSIMGTAQYLSPEQAQGHPVSAQSDLYAIGIVLYELLTGQVPFDADSAVSIALKQVNEPPTPPARLNRQITPELEAVVLRALEKDRAHRFADADEFSAALEAARSRLPAAAGVGAGAAAADATRVTDVEQDTGVYAPVAAHERLPPPPPRVRREPESRGPRWWLWGLIAAVVGGVALAVGLLASGGEKVAVPNVVGSSISAATSALERKGFEVRPVRDTSDKPRNQVIAQSPAGGTTADKGSEVTINVSEGPAVLGVPRVVGDGRRAARRTLQAAGFKVEEEFEFSEDTRINRVISQSPPAGSQVQQGETITLTVSKGQERIGLPDVVGRSEDEARSMLSDAGFGQVTVQRKESDKEDPGTVLTQQPGGSTDVPRDTPIKLTVAEQSKEIEVPDVVGEDQDGAIKALRDAGLQVDSREAPVTSSDQDGIVQSQSPSGGRKVRRGTRAAIVVGRVQASTGPTGAVGDATSPVTPPGGTATPP